MTAIVIRNFAGMVPRMPPELLPEGAAAFANNCDLNLNVLSGIRANEDIWAPNLPVDRAAPIKGIFTYNGTHFYTWPTFVQAYKGPVVSDSVGNTGQGGHQRIYYLEEGILYAAYLPETHEWNNAYLYGGHPTFVGNPSPRVLVGVPNPTVAPVLEVVERQDLYDYPSAELSFKYWWTDGVNRWGTADLGPHGELGEGNAFREYWFDTPPYPAAEVPPEGEPPSATSPPSGLVLVIEATLRDIDSGAVLFVLNSAGNSTVPATSSALPGGVEMSVTLNAPNLIHFTWGITDTRAYVSTITNYWNEESGPSPASIISPTYLQDIKLTTTIPPMSNYLRYDRTTIYRTYGTQAYLKADTEPDPDTAGSGNPEFFDRARTVTAVGTALISLDWRPPPSHATVNGVDDGGINGFVAMPNGWYAAFKNNVLYMSEPYRPHTWQYTLTYPQRITGICAGPQALVVATATSMYNVIGPHPASVNSVELDVACGGISQWGMCKAAGGVAIVTQDGIMFVQGSTATLEISQRYWTREKWKEDWGFHIPAFMLGFHDGRLLCASGEYATGFMFRLDENVGQLTYLNTLDDPRYTALVRLPREDSLYMATFGNEDGSGDTARVKRFCNHPTDHILGEWASKEVVFPNYVKFGACFMRISAVSLEDGGRPNAEVHLILVADDEYVFNKYFTIPPNSNSVANVSDGYQTNLYFRLPPHRGARRWQVRLSVTSAASIREIALAQDYGELQSV